MINEKLRPIVKWHGGKHYLHEWIISNFPSDYTNLHYIEPFVGGGSVFFNKPTSNTTDSIINDLDRDLWSIYYVVHSKHFFPLFLDKLSKLEYNRGTFEAARDACDIYSTDILDHAVNQYVKYRMSRGGLGKSFAWSTRLRGGIPGDVNAWNTAIDQLVKLHEKLNSEKQQAYIFNLSANHLLNTFNVENSFVYCDPPYLPETRVSKKAYNKEMTKEQHIELAYTLNTYKGKILLSGYHSKLYDNLYKNWRCIEKSIVNHSSQQRKNKPIKTEVLWANY